ncbi:DEAD/DEAH box helicase, partial [Longicatena caecimuris]
IIYNNFNNEELNEKAKLLFKFMPYYKLFDYSKEYIEKILCFLLDEYGKLNEFNKIKLDLFLIDFGWISHKRNKNIYNNDIISIILHRMFKHKDIYFTKEQFELYSKLISFYENVNEKTFYISAPTSFGKTTIVVDSLEKYLETKRNILIILPNKNLINEMSIKIKEKYKKLESNISSSVMSFIENYSVNKTNIFIGTAERYFGINQINDSIDFDLLIVDEAYKIYNYIDERSRHLSLTVKKHINKSKIIFLTPHVNIDSLKKRLNCLDIFPIQEIENTFTSEVVSYNNIILKHKTIGEIKYYKLNEKKKELLKIINTNIIERKMTEYELLSNLFEEFPFTQKKSIIYLNNPDKVYEMAKCMKANLKQTPLKTNVSKAYYKYLDENFPDSYILKELLYYGIVINIGSMDELSKKFSINTFIKDEQINFIIANATINEGVNLYAKNIILLTSNLMANSSDIDIMQKNLLGRVGRFNQFFIGNRIIIDTSQNDNVVVKRLKKSLDLKPIKISNPAKVVDENIANTIAKDIMFNDNFLERNAIKREKRVTIPLSRYSYPESVYNAIEKHCDSLEISELETYLQSFFSYDNLLQYLKWFKDMLVDIHMEYILFPNKTDQRNLPYLVTLYLDYLNGVSIKKIISKNENAVLDENGKGQLYFRFGSIYINNKADFAYWDTDNEINLLSMSNEEKADFENRYILQLLKDINLFCSYILKKILMVTFNIIINKTQTPNNRLYNQYWNMLESGTMNFKVLKLLSQGIEDKYLQNIIISNDKIYDTIANSQDIERSIIEIFGCDSVEYYAYIF